MADPEYPARRGRATPLIGPVNAPRLHVMTYNLRASGFQTDQQAGRDWPGRRQLVAALVDRERPTVLCTQEGRFRQLVELRSDLDGYDWIHLGREGGGRGESTAILWDAARLEPLDYDHVWLSRRPYRIGSRSWGSRAIRMFTWVRFRDRATGREFCVVDNHLDHRSERARRKGAMINADLVRRVDVPVIVAGDFNCDVGSAAHRTLTAAGLSDAWKSAAERLTPEWRTANHWSSEPVEGGPRIDWILTGPGVAVERAAINTWTKDGATPSDHWPVQALVRLT